jgi:DNA-directed RNA polymerase specialized sigma subunit
MTVTIARLMARLAADLGREPTDAEVAATLAISPARVQHHRRLIRGLPP